MTISGEYIGEAAIEQAKEGVEGLKVTLEGTASSGGIALEQLKSCFASLESTIQNATAKAIEQVKGLNNQFNNQAGITGINQTLGAVNKMGNTFKSVTGIAVVMLCV